MKDGTLNKRVWSKFKSVHLVLSLLGVLHWTSAFNVSVARIVFILFAILLCFFGKKELKRSPKTPVDKEFEKKRWTSDFFKLTRVDIYLIKNSPTGSIIMLKLQCLYRGRSLSVNRNLNISFYFLYIQLRG